MNSYLQQLNENKTHNMTGALTKEAEISQTLQCLHATS